MRQNKLKTEILVTMFVDQHLTLREIGRLVGMSATAVQKRLRKAGVKRDDGEWVDCSCAHCGRYFTVQRALWRQHKGKYCTAECYYGKRENPDYFQWRQGQRRARKLVSEYFRLLPGHVIDHRDGDNRNNSKENLRVYASQSDHMKMHHGGKVEPLWDGAVDGDTYEYRLREPVR